MRLIIVDKKSKLVAIFTIHAYHTSNALLEYLMKKVIALVLMTLALAFPTIIWALMLEPHLGENAHFGYIFDAARLFALIAFVLFFIQFLLASKVRFLERGLGLDRLIHFHRNIGIAAFILAFLHGESIAIMSVIRTGAPPQNPFVFMGFIANFLLIITTVVALFYKPFRIRYEIWRWIHRVNYVVFPLIFVHSMAVGRTIRYNRAAQVYWVILGVLFLALIAYRIVRYFIVHSKPYEVVRVTNETHNVTTIAFKGERREYLPGQFLTVELVRGGKKASVHPFTISSSPTQDELAISIKQSGDFTKTIADTKPGDTAFIDYPYGIFSYLNFPSEKYVFIAGGIGITPFIAMLRHMRDTNTVRNVTLLWGNQTDADIAFRDELEALQKDMPNILVVHVMSRQEDFEGEKGFVTTALIKRYVPQVDDCEVFLCGPPKMMNNVRSSLRTLNVAPAAIHFERFAL